ncbi:MAG: RNA polymerase-binding protein RpbA [Bacilli bacterium]
MSNAFTYTNTIRQAWIPHVQGTMLDVKFQYLTREDRFETYAEIDRDVHDKAIELMRKYADEMTEQGNNTKICTLGRFVIEKQFQKDIESFVHEAAALVIAELKSDLE